MLHYAPRFTTFHHHTPLYTITIHYSLPLFTGRDQAGLPAGEDSSQRNELHRLRPLLPRLPARQQAEHADRVNGAAAVGRAVQAGGECSVCVVSCGGLYVRIENNNVYCNWNLHICNYVLTSLQPYIRTCTLPQIIPHCTVKRVLYEDHEGAVAGADGTLHPRYVLC